VCDSDAHSPAPVSAGAFDVLVVTCAAADLKYSNGDDPRVIAQRAVADVAKWMPAVPDGALDAFCGEVYEWICQHRASASLADE
jgi:hypothetical protein